MLPVLVVWVGWFGVGGGVGVWLGLVWGGCGCGVGCWGARNRAAGCAVAPVQQQAQRRRGCVASVGVGHGEQCPSAGVLFG